MASVSDIEWTDATWQPITGCSIVSPGCAHCYAMKLAGGRLRNHPSRKGLTDDSKNGPVWNGKVRFNEQWLTQPLRWRKPSRVFVCAHGDLFHEDVPDEWIDRVFAVMASAPQHTFQVLTKRAERMRKYCRHHAETWCPTEKVKPIFSNEILRDLGIARVGPLPNVWLGVSTERQQEFDERVVHLLHTPAAVRFVSAEPLLGPVTLKSVPCVIPGEPGYGVRKLDWVIVGGESGHGARPMHPDWARKLRDACAANDIPFFFKQWGEHAPFPVGFPIANPRVFYVRGRGYPFQMMGDDLAMVAVGKKAAGRTLDGAIHDAMPGRAA